MPGLDEWEATALERARVEVDPNGIIEQPAGEPLVPEEGTVARGVSSFVGRERPRPDDSPVVNWGASRSRFRGPPVNTPRGVYRQREKGVTDNRKGGHRQSKGGSPTTPPTTPGGGHRQRLRQRQGGVTDNATDNARGGSPTTPRHRQWFLGGVFPEFPGRLKTFACKNVVTATKPTHLLTFLFERKIDSPSCKTPPNAPIPNLPGRT